MKVLLQKDVADLGKKGEIQEVSLGYARNYLIPSGLAVPASKEVVAAHEAKAKNTQEQEEKMVDEFQKAVKALKDKKLIIVSKAQEDGKLFGSVKAEDIAAYFSELLSSEFPASSIELTSPIKEVGEHTVALSMNNVSESVALVVEAEK